MNAEESHSSRKGNKIIDLRAVGEETKQLAAAGPRASLAQSAGSGDQQTSSTVISNTIQKTTNKKPKQRKAKVQTLQLDHGIHQAFQGDTGATNGGLGKEEHSLEDEDERSTQHERQMEQDAENKAQAGLRKWSSRKF